MAAPWQVHACKLADVYDNLSDMPNMPAEPVPTLSRARQCMLTQSRLSRLRNCTNR